MTIEYRVPEIIIKIKCLGIKGIVFTKIKSKSKHIYGIEWLNNYSIAALRFILKYEMLKIVLQ